MTPGAPFAATALVLLAAGRSSRFEAGDKLLATLNGRPLIDHAAGALAAEAVAARIGVVGPPHATRAARLRDAGWRIVENPEWASGQGTSLAAGIRAAAGARGVDAALVLLADMPCVPDGHVQALRMALTGDVEAVFTRADGRLGPPAVFARAAFARLAALDGDRGARAILPDLAATSSVDLDPDLAADVDRLADLHGVTAAPHD